MADPLPVSLVKQHLRLERDDEDAYLSQLSSAAVMNFEVFTGRVLVDSATLPPDLVDNQIPAYPDIVQGLLMLVSHWYEHREMAAEKPLSEIPAASHALWSPYVFFHLGDPADDGNPNP